MWEELGISGGTAIIILIALYFVIKWAVRNGIEEAYSNITGKPTFEESKMFEQFEQWDKEEKEERERKKEEKKKEKEEK